MFQQRVTQNLALGIKTYQHLQVATKSTSGRFYSSTQIFALGILSFVNHINQLLALGIGLLYGIGVSYLQVVDTHHRLDTIGQRLGFLIGNRTLGKVVHKSQDTTHDNCYSGEHQHHI